MNKFDAYKCIFFSEESRLHLCAKLGVDTFDDAYKKLFFDLNSTDLQTILAPFLRAFAIKQLTDRKTPRSQEISQYYTDRNYVNTEINDHRPDNFGDFLNEQSKNSKYGTELEAIALAEVFDVNFACILVHPVTYQPVYSPIIYHEATNANQPIIRLYNIPGYHYFVEKNEPSSTLGDGNCLYNGFALFLKQFIIKEDNLLNNNKLLVEIYANQRKILKEIQDIKMLSLAKLTEQINNPDYQAALHVVAKNLIKKESLSSFSADLFLKIINHPTFILFNQFVLLATIVTLGIGLCCLFPSSAAFLALAGITMTPSIAIPVTTCAATVIMGASALSVFSNHSLKLEETTVCNFLP